MMVKPMPHELVPTKYLPPGRFADIYFDREALRLKAEDERLLNHMNMSVHPSIMLTLLDRNSDELD